MCFFPKAGMGRLPDINFGLHLCRERRECFPCDRLQRKPCDARAVMHDSIANPQKRGNIPGNPQFVRIW